MTTPQRLLNGLAAAVAAASFVVIAHWQGQLWLRDRAAVAAIEAQLARPVGTLEQVLRDRREERPYRRVTGLAYPAPGELYMRAEQHGEAGVRVFVPLRLDGLDRRVIADLGLKLGPPPNAVVPTLIDAERREDLNLRKTFPALTYNGVLLPSEALAPEQQPDMAHWVWPVADVPSMLRAMRVRNAPNDLYLYVESPARGWLQTAPYTPRSTWPHLALALAALVAAIFVPVLLLLIPSSREIANAPA